MLGACLAWAIDNSLTRKVSLADATFVAMVKGLTAGAVNTGLALAFGGILPAMKIMIAAGGIGFLSYGVSLALFVVALRNLGTARTGAYFSTAPFAGALIAIPLLSEPVTVQLTLAGVLMGAGVWLHLTGRHDHRHTHASLAHEHVHEHDAHHQHPHPGGQSADLSHQHPHVHEPSTHTHPHFPDTRHRHRH